MKRSIALIILLVIALSGYAQRNKKAKQVYTLKIADSLFTSQQWKEAVPAYESVLKTSPANALAWNRLGFSYHNLGNYDKAMENYVKSLEQKPAPPIETVVHARMARIYSLKSDPDKAFGSIDKALTLGYVNTGELNNNADFANIRRDTRFEQAVKRATENAMPCLAMKQAREFDFWIGEWDAYVTGTNNLAGYSRIDKASGGCMILENWTSKGSVAYEGKSMNFIDPATNKWKQVWVGSNGTNVSEFLNGEYRDGAMRFEFQTVDAQNNKQYVHFYFFNQGQDQVRQFHETSPDGKVWTTTYDFTYKRRQ